MVVPALIFASFLLAGSAVLTFLFDPGRYPVHVGSSVIRLQDLQSEYDALLAHEQELIRQEASLDELTPTPTLDALRMLRNERAPYFEAIVAAERARGTFALSSGNPVVFDRVVLSEDSTLKLDGSVRDQSGRTMQLLASFIDRLREQSVFASVSEPEYRELINPDGIPTSPFSLLLTLKRD